MEEQEVWQRWLGGSAVKGIGCSPRGPQFESQHSDGSSQLAITLVPSTLFWPL